MTSSDWSNFNLKGFDVNMALANLDDRPALYQRLVGVFRQTLPDTHEQISHKLSTDDFSGAAVLVHSLAGSALTLGAQDFYHFCKQAENQLKISPQSVNPEELLQSLDQQLEKVNSTLDEVVAAMN